MPTPNVLPAGLLQSAALQDTIVMVPHRDLFDWASGIAQVAALFFALVMLWRMVVVMKSLRSQVHKTATAVEQLVAEAHPLLKSASGVLEDAREVVAMVRTDVERLTVTSGMIRERVADAVEATTQRIDEVNAVLDVLQTQLENTAIGTVSAIHGVRVGTRALTHGLAHGAIEDRDVIDEFNDIDAIDDEHDLEDLDDLDDLEDLDDIDDIDLDDEAKPA